MMRPADLVQEICRVRLEHTFNPYIEICEAWDREDAAHRRRSTLTSLLERAATAQIDAIWVGRDLGYRGGRRTGLALTDEAHMSIHGKRWNFPIERATKGAPVAERTARMIWDVLSQIEGNIFLWNVFPFHPFEPGKPLSNRAHTAAERRIGEDILFALITMLKPRRVIAIGNDAYNALERMCPENAVKVRHPSYGGQADFNKGIQELYGVSSLRKTNPIQLSIV